MVKSLDTNVVLRYVVRDVVDQLNSVLHLLKDKSIKYSIADQVIVEVEYVLINHYGLDRVDVAHALEVFLEQEWVLANRVLFRKVLPQYVANNKVSLVDLMLVGYAELNNATPLLTFDKNLSKTSINVELLK